VQVSAQTGTIPINAGQPVRPNNNLIKLEINMTWTTPAATDLRFGFEITMYIANR
jgi:coenzyme PQQ precursor peptide PqqA